MITRHLWLDNEEITAAAQTHRFAEDAVDYLNSVGSGGLVYFFPYVRR